MLTAKIIMVKGEKGEKGEKGDIAGACWGGITGDIDEQQDLQEVFNNLWAELSTKVNIADMQAITTAEIDDIVEEA